MTPARGAAKKSCGGSGWRLRRLKPPAPRSSAQEPLPELPAEARDPPGLLGWGVVLPEGRVGRVTEVLGGGDAAGGERSEPKLRVRLEGRSGRLHGDGALVPLAPGVIVSAHAQRRLLFVDPDRCALGLGDLSAALEELREKLTAHVDLAAPRPRLPTAARLLSLGRPDIVEDIEECGGFAEVSDMLQLWQSRITRERWEDLDELKSQLLELIDTFWVVQSDPDLLDDEGEPQRYYFNQASNVVTFVTPEPMSGGGGPQPTLPEVSLLKMAGRDDIIKAISEQGGRMTLAKLLGWRARPYYGNTYMHCWADFKNELLFYIEERDAEDPESADDISCFPSPSELLDDARDDLFNAARVHGGFHACARRLGLPTRRLQKRPYDYSDPKAVATEIVEFTAFLEAGGLDRGDGYLPCPTDLRRAGRPDLEVQLRRHGHNVLEEFTAPRKWSPTAYRGNPGDSRLLPFDVARELARQVAAERDLRSRTRWVEWARGSARAMHLPVRPDRAYLDSFVSWKHWLGTEFPPFKEARDFVRELAPKLGIGTRAQYCEWVQGRGKVHRLPYNPQVTYKGDWVSWADFLASEGLSFEAARSAARQLASERGLRSREAWRRWAKAEGKSRGLPYNPSSVYKDDWVSWSDWLGTERDSRRRAVSFADARDAAHALGLQSQAEWREFQRSEACLPGVPSRPDVVYKNSGWSGWKDFLHGVSKDRGAGEPRDGA